MSSEETFETPEIEARAYVNQPVWKRIVVIGAGPAVNLVLAFVLATVVFMGVGSHPLTGRSGQLFVTNRVEAIIPGTAAAGVLKPGDKIVSVDGVKGDPARLRNQIAKHSCAAGARTEGCTATHGGEDCRATGWCVEDALDSSSVELRRQGDARRL